MKRKYLKIFTLLFLLSTTFFVITACSNSNNSEEALLSSAANYDVDFVVTDESNDAAVADAELTLAGETKFTDVYGKVTFEKISGKYDLDVKAVNYQDLTISILIESSEPIPVELVPEKPVEPEPGDEEDTKAPFLTDLFALVDNTVYGVDNPQLEKLIWDLIDKDPDLEKSYDYFILYFSEFIEQDGDLDLEKDFEIKPLNDNPIKISNAVLNSEFLMLKINDGILNDYDGIVRVIINESGREKIFDLAGNMLESDPNYLEVEIGDN